MKKLIMIIALIAGIIGANNVFAKQCETPKEVKQEMTEKCEIPKEVKEEKTTEAECYVHVMDGVVSCKD